MVFWESQEYREWQGIVYSMVEVSNEYLQHLKQLPQIDVDWC